MDRDSFVEMQLLSCRQSDKTCLWQCLCHNTCCCSLLLRTHCLIFFTVKIMKFFQYTWAISHTQTQPIKQHRTCDDKHKKKNYGCMSRITLAIWYFRIIQSINCKDPKQSGSAFLSFTGPLYKHFVSWKRPVWKKRFCIVLYCTVTVLHCWHIYMYMYMYIYWVTQNSEK